MESTRKLSEIVKEKNKICSEIIPSLERNLVRTADLERTTEVARLEGNLKYLISDYQNYVDKLRVEIEDRLPSETKCDHHYLTEIKYLDRIVYECENCGAVLSEPEHHSIISHSKEVY